MRQILRLRASRRYANSMRDRGWDTLYALSPPRHPRVLRDGPIAIDLFADEGVVAGLQLGDLDDFLRPLGKLNDLAAVLVRSRHRLLIFLQPLVESPVAVFDREMPEGLGDLELQDFACHRCNSRVTVYFSVRVQGAAAGAPRGAASGPRRALPLGRGRGYKGGSLQHNLDLI